MVRYWTPNFLANSPNSFLISHHLASSVDHLNPLKTSPEYSRAEVYGNCVFQQNLLIFNGLKTYTVNDSLYCQMFEFVGKYYFEISVTLYLEISFFDWEISCRKTSPRFLIIFGWWWKWNFIVNTTLNIKIKQYQTMSNATKICTFVDTQVGPQRTQHV